MQKQKVSEWFTVSKKQRNGMLVMLAIIVMSILAQSLLSLFIKPARYDHSEFEKEIAALKIQRPDSAYTFKRKFDDREDTYQPYNQPYEKRYNDQQPWKGELFYFDPNTIEEAGWQRLGVRDKTISTIKNFLSKGGKFYKAEDIKKIWGLNEELAGKLIPYIRIEKKEYAAAEKPVYEKKTYAPAIIDINTADTAALIALPGIGSKLAQRIVSFRDKLGGFHTVDQVGETFGLPDSTFQKLKPRLRLDNNTLRQVNINTATFDELKAHPYIKYTIGNAIFQYRVQHGNFSSMKDLKKIMLVTDEVYNKLLPYVKVE